MANAALHLPDDRYIPIRTADVLAAIVRDAGEHDATLTAFAEALERIVHAESSALSGRLERAYAPFNPDRETVTVGDDGASTRGLETLASVLDYTFDKANYDLLEDAQVSAAVASASVHGMKVRVNPDKVGDLQIYVRGRTQETRLVRTVRRPITGEMRDVDLYRRLAIVYRMPTSFEVGIKLFREIPVVDLEALLPHAEVGMSMFDRIKILGGGVGAVSGATWQAVTLLVQGTMIAGQYFWALTLGLAGLSVRSVLGYRRARDLRISQRTHHLYYQNIANNAGVLDLLVSSIRHEEVKETLLAYALLVLRPGEATDRESLSRLAEQWIADRFYVKLDYDVADALESIDRLGLWEDRDALRPVNPEVACARLDAKWRERDTEDYHARSMADRA